MSQLLLRENATVTVCHSHTSGLADIVRTADIVVAAIGQPQLIRGSWIKPGAAVIDVGINSIKGGPSAGGSRGRVNVARTVFSAHAGSARVCAADAAGVRPACAQTTRKSRGRRWWAT